MILLNVVPDTSMMVSGYEHHTLQCSGCYEVEHRLVFSQRSGSQPDEAIADGAVHRNENRPAEAAAVGEATAPLPASSTAWGRVVEKVRAQQADLTQRAEIAKTHEEIDLSNPHRENLTPPRQNPVVTKTPRADRTGLQMCSGVLGTDRDPGRTEILAPVPSMHRSHASTMAESVMMLAKLEAAEDFDRVWENLLPHHDPAFRPGAACNIDGVQGDQPPPACEA